MKTANYRIMRQVEGRGSFADVWVCDCAESDAASLAGTPPEWVAAAQRGVSSALVSLGRTLAPVSISRVIYTHVDTTEDTVHAAAFMATAKLLDRAHAFQLARQQGKWCVLTVETA